MKFPKNLKYTKDHEWLSPVSGGTAKVGVTAYAIEHLGDIVHVEMPEIGQSFDGGDPFGTIESTKTVSDIYLPVSGKISEVNKQIASNPEKLQDDAYENGWIIEIEVPGGADTSHLMNAEAYEKYVSELKD